MQLSPATAAWLAQLGYSAHGLQPSQQELLDPAVSMYFCAAFCQVLAQPYVSEVLAQHAAAMQSDGALQQPQHLEDIIDLNLCEQW